MEEYKMISITIGTEIISSKEIIEGVKISVDVFNSPDQVKIQVGNQEVMLNKELALQAFGKIEEAKLSNRELPINIVDGRFV